MEELLHPIYNQVSSAFTLILYLRRDVLVDGKYIINIVEHFIDRIAPLSSVPHRLDTYRNTRMNTGDFTEARWKMTRRKLLSGVYSGVGISCRIDDINESMLLDISVNPTTQKVDDPNDPMIVGEVSISLPMNYLKLIVADPEKVRALLDFGKEAWNNLPTGMAYGYGNIGIWTRYPKERMKRPHPIPVAYASGNIDFNLKRFYASGEGIKGAFWANFLSECYVKMIGDVEKVKEQLPGFQVEELAGNGLLIVATETPLPEDSEENRNRFLLLHKVLQPAFLSLEQLPNKEHLVGYFYREREDIMEETN